jgi:hypothetical protein
MARLGKPADGISGVPLRNDISRRNTRIPGVTCLEDLNSLRSILVNADTSGMPPQEEAGRGSDRPGYPVDGRPAHRVASLHRSVIGDFESAAARVVARLTAARVFLQNDGSQSGMVDIRVEYPGRPAAYVEVWTDVGGGYASTYAELLKRGGQLPLEVPVARSGRDWFMTVSGATHLRTLEDELVAHVTALEATATTFEIVADLVTLSRHPNPSVARLVELGVVMLSSRPASAEHGVIRLYPSGITGPRLVSWPPVLDWVAQTLTSPRLADVRAKLARTGALERHAFLGITFSSPGNVYFALSRDDRTLPSEPARLPAEITHLWLMNAPPLGRCLAWFPDRGWLDVSKHWANE